MSNDLYWILAGDIHFPKHDKRLVDLLLKAMDFVNPDAIDLVGDIDDADSTSRWAAGTSREGLSLEDFGVRDTREFMADLSRKYPNADRHLHDGNHGWYRHKQYLDKKAPATLDYITPDVLYQYNVTGFEFHHYDKPPVHRYGDIYVHHGESISKYAGESVRNDVNNFGVSLIRGHCFSDDTEILSDKGWTRYSDVKVGTTVYTLNLETGQGEWQNVSEKFVYSDYKRMVSIKGRSIDLLVTDGHGLVEKTKGGFNIFKANDLLLASKHKKFDIPLAAESNSAGLSISDEKLRALAWFMAEGNYDKYTCANGDVRYRSRLAQSDGSDSRLSRISECFESISCHINWIKRYSAGKIEHGQHRNFDAYRGCIPRKEFEWAKEYINFSKEPKDVLYGLSARQAKVFLEEYIWADGCKNSDAKNSYQIASNNTVIRDFIQTLATMAGYRSSISGPRRGVWYITYNTRNSTMITPENNVSEVDYVGDVWCVTVPNHTVVVRRNGKVAITMNSHRMGSYYYSYPLRNETLRGFEIGHLCDPKQMSYDTNPNWQPGFAMAHVSGNDVFVNLIEIIDYKCSIDGTILSS